MSTRRLCAVEDELCARVPSRAPNNLFPRFRSSSFLLSSCSGARLGFAGGDDPPSTWSIEPSSDNRGRLLFASETDDCLRLADSGGDSCSTVSGKITADATSLEVMTLAAI